MPRFLVRRWLTVGLVVAASTAVLIAGRPQTAPATYFPAKGVWEKKDPASPGLDKAKVDEAVALAIARQSKATGIPVLIRCWRR